MRSVSALIAACLALIVLRAGPATAVTVTRTADLSFGQVLIGSTGAVTIPANAFGRPFGAVSLLLKGSQCQQCHPGAFTIVNDTSSQATYSLSLASTPTDLGSPDLPLGAFTLSQGAVTLPPNGSAIVYVGATLIVTSTRPSGGNHTATVPITLRAQ